MNDKQRDDCLIEIKIKVAKMSTDIHWLKRIITATAVLIGAVLGIQLPDIFIHD